MILLISCENNVSSDIFMEWCNYTSTEVIRVNENESFNIVELIKFENDTYNVKFKIREKIVNLNDIDGVWFRRGRLQTISKVEYLPLKNIPDINSIREYFRNESNTLTEFISYLLKQKKSLNDPYKYNSNKLITLITAQQIGLKIPDTLITQKMEDVKSSFKGKDIITKSIQDAIVTEYKEYKFSPRPFRVSLKDSNNPDFSFYSKFQAFINKKYEIRVFFVGVKYFSCALFEFWNEEYADKQFKEDRRSVPYRLPEDVLSKLIMLNEILGYNSGSIDMLVDADDVHYFLEINPVGQYDYVNKLCNYHLDLEILSYFKK